MTSNPVIFIGESPPPWVSICLICTLRYFLSPFDNNFDLQSFNLFQVRKLEFVLADALDKKCDTVLTCGGLPSNHCRTTAVAARQLGLKCYLLLRSSDQATHFSL